jgi:tRNA(Ile)-lysidine synthase
MLRAAVALKRRCGGSGRLFVGHLNHGLRDAEADEDVRWLQQLCEKLAMPLEVGKADMTSAARQRDGLEAAARAARYDFLRDVAESLGARFVAVAHTADDQIETVLYRILRGTGIAGLRGIPRVRALSPSVALIRPILAMRRRDVLEYLTAIGQDFRTDSSNANPRWTRNRLRNELLPALRKYYQADVDNALLRLAAQAIEAQAIIEDLAARLVESAVEKSEVQDERTRAGREKQILRINCRRLDDQAALVVREVCKIAWQQMGWPLQSMGFDEWQQLAAMILSTGDVPVVNLPGNVLARREHDVLNLTEDGLS